MDQEPYHERSSANSLKLDVAARNFLYSTARWGKFLAISGFVIIGIVLLVGVVAGIFMGSTFAGAGLGGLEGGLVAGVYLVLALLYFFPVLYLYRFSVKMKQGLEAQDQGEVSDSFGNLKSLFKFLGILMMVVLGIYGLILVFGLVAGAASLF